MPSIGCYCHFLNKQTNKTMSGVFRCWDELTTGKAHCCLVEFWLHTRCPTWIITTMGTKWENVFGRTRSNNRPVKWQPRCSAPVDRRRFSFSIVRDAKQKTSSCVQVLFLFFYKNIYYKIQFCTVYELELLAWPISALDVIQNAAGLRLFRGFNSSAGFAIEFVMIYVWSDSKLCEKWIPNAHIWTWPMS